MVEQPAYDAVAVGDMLPPLQAEPISRLALALYCGTQPVTSRGTVAEKLDGRRVRLALSVADQSGVEKLAGEAVVVLA